MEQITGKIKEIIHYANGFGVIKFSYGKTSRTAAGRMPKPNLGAMIDMEGEWKRHTRNGLQFNPVFKQKTEYEILLSLVGSEMCIRDRKKIFTV